MSRLLPLAFALGGLMLSSATGALAQCEVSDPEALRWLSRMSYSLRETSYSGVFTYQQGNAVQAMRITHSVAGNMENEQITRLSGENVRVQRMAHPLDCIHTGHRLVRLGDTYRRQNGQCGVAAHYDLRMAGTHRIAGRSAVIINVLPRDRFRYGYQMALDRDTGLLLKTQTVAEDGRILERFQFADLTIGDVSEPGTDVEVIHEAAHVLGGDRPAASDGSTPWTVRWLPEGFRLTEDIAGSEYNKTFTDGLASFSVFLEQMPDMELPGSGVARQGGTTSYSRGLKLSGQPVLITVLGEIPTGTARQVADSVAWTATVSSR
ncbi:MAG: MucB/RseB C-terminal domain-containing protein [Pseudomonadota bacterium]